ncbi:hypothetical protein [Saccharopolyspora sp. NPDC002686]|uniref:hypothetical protein n=1 Tax=Saccharopolyspora sp. NPDC002686 TaxID=3154541 RepID=UPI003316B535
MLVVIGVRLVVFGGGVGAALLSAVVVGAAVVLAAGGSGAGGGGAAGGGESARGELAVIGNAFRALVAVAATSAAAGSSLTARGLRHHQRRSGAGCSAGNE